MSYHNYASITSDDRVLAKPGHVVAVIDIAAGNLYSFLQRYRPGAKVVGERKESRWGLFRCVYLAVLSTIQADMSNPIVCLAVL